MGDAMLVETVTIEIHCDDAPAAADRDAFHPFWYVVEAVAEEIRDNVVDGERRSGGYVFDIVANE